MPYYGNEEVYKKVVGEKVVSVDHVDTYEDTVNVHFESGSRLALQLHGDCCSHSYYTDTKQFDELIGSTIISIEERGGKSDQVPPEEDSEGWDRHTLWSFLVIATDKGHVTIDWRNDSNGYYSGSVNPVFYND